MSAMSAVSAAPRVRAPSFVRQLGSGFAIFAVVLAASLPLAFVSESLALAVAVGVGSVFLALLARRLRIALLIATLMAVLGAFGASHSIHLAVRDAPGMRALGDLAPAAGVAIRGEGPMPAAMMMPPRVSMIAAGERTPLAGWAFAPALFALWAVGFAAILLNRALLHWVWRRFGAAV